LEEAKNELRPTALDWVMVWNVLKKKYKQENALWRLLRIFSEMGDAAKSITYLEYYKIGHKFKDDVIGYKAELKLALADTLAQTYMMILNAGLNLNEVETLGMNHLKDAINNRLPY